MAFQIPKERRRMPGSPGQRHSGKLAFTERNLFLAGPALLKLKHFVALPTTKQLTGGATMPILMLTDCKSCMMLTAKGNLGLNWHSGTLLLEAIIGLLGSDGSHLVKVMT